MSTRLYVGNLSPETTRQALVAAFAAAGTVLAVHIPTDRASARPRGFAFVTMGTSEEAAHAIARLDGAVIDGKAVHVREASDGFERRALRRVDREG